MSSASKSHYIDGLTVYYALFKGLRQKILKKPLVIYHQEHPRRAAGIKTTFSTAVYNAYKELARERREKIFNDEHWGLGYESLSEESL
jgi:hypothetical protein